MSPSADSPQPRVLVTNDDGWDSPGLAAMVEVLSEFAEVYVVAPKENHSGLGAAITLNEPLESEPVAVEGARAAWRVSGTPADCVKLALCALLAPDAYRVDTDRAERPGDAPPALCVSGLNDGPNVGVNVFYSGTVGAAIESAVNGVPAVSVSKQFGDSLAPREAARLVAPLLEKALARGLPPWHILNVNLPDLPPADVRGMRLTRHGVSGYVERYLECEADEATGGRPAGDQVRRWRLTGEVRLREGDGLTDAEALAEGYVSVTPMALDLTAGGKRELARDEWDWLAGPDLLGR